MHQALRLLLGLRAAGWLRRWTHQMRTLRGAVVGVTGLLALLPLAVAALLAPRIQVAEQVALIRQYGPLGLLGYCVLNVLLSAGERAVHYTPAEVGILFAGPFRPRELLVYKIAAMTPIVGFVSVLLTLVFQHHTFSPWAAFAGLFLALEMLFLLSVAIALGAGTVGALAFDRRHRALVATVLGLVLVAPFALAPDAATALRRIGQSPVVAAAAAPFRPVVMTFTAERVWPDLMAQAGLACLVDLALLAAVTGLNVRFLDASASASARRYERAGVGAPVHRVGLPGVPWMWGAGPTLWRQLATAARRRARLGAIVLLFMLPLAVCWFWGAGPAATTSTVHPALIVLAGLTVFGPTVAHYDFRRDVGRMDELKTLPVRPSALVVGQLATPVLVLSAGEWLGLALVGTRLELPRELIPAAAVLAPPWNFLLVGVENLLFLWFPGQWVAGVSGEFQTLGRQLLTMVGRLACGLVAAGLSGGLGAAAFYLAGERWSVALVAGALGLAATCAGLVVVLAQAFHDFDVARDRFE